MKPILVLFDIDGTILKVEDGLSKSIFQKVFCDFFNLKEYSADFDFDFSGLTDLEILFRLSQIYNIDFQLVIENQSQLWQKLLDEFKMHCKKDKIFIYENVMEFISELNERDNVTLGLLTGNFQECAYYKLELAGLKKYFPFGAFGNESLERSKLHRIAITRGNTFIGKEIFFNYNTFVIGDSIADILASKANDIKVIAVATGKTPYEILAERQPNLLVHSFSEEENIFNFLGL
jgi:phosphoglycolate phosphatase-like HAD superfamily hydrolase